MKLEDIKLNQPYLYKPTGEIVLVKSIKEIHYEWPEPVVKFPDGSTRPVSSKELVEIPIVP